MMSDLGSNTSGHKRFEHLLDELVGLQLTHGDVHRHGEVVAEAVPRRGLAAGLGEHPLPDGDDHPGLLQHRDELGGTDDPTRRVAPA